MNSFALRKRVLIAEDNSVLRAALADVLARDYEVFVASDGAEALGRARSLDFDLLLTDLRMPRIDGLLLAQRIRALRPEIKVVLHTGSVPADLPTSPPQVGIDAVIHKGLPVDELRALLASLMGLNASDGRELPDTHVCRNEEQDYQRGNTP